MLICWYAVPPALAGVLAWYLDKVLPSEFGTPLPLYFPFLPSYWGIDIVAIQRILFPPEREDRKSLIENAHGLEDNGTADAKVKQEALSAELAKQRADGRSVSIRGLRKVFAAQGGSERVAVSGLNLDLFEGQVSVLLGHNGAGKRVYDRSQLFTPEHVSVKCI